MLGRDASKYAFSMSPSRVLIDRGDRRLTSSRPGDNNADEELALMATDNLESFDLLSGIFNVTGAEIPLGISFRFVLLLFRQASEAMGGGGAGLLATSCLLFTTSRRSRSLAAAVVRSIVLILAKG